MQNLLFTLTVLLLLSSGAMLTGCKTAEEKEQKAELKVADAENDLRIARNASSEAARKEANAAEWRAFKNESEIKIKENEFQIAELKAKIKQQGKAFDALYAAKIDVLEKKNLEMKARIEAYEKSQSNWENFKREFNNEIDELRKALKELDTNTKK